MEQLLIKTIMVLLCGHDQDFFLMSMMTYYTSIMSFTPEVQFRKALFVTEFKLNNMKSEVNRPLP